MLKSKWFAITKNEYRIRTSGIREIRPYFPFLAIAALGVYVLYIAPAIIDVLLNDPAKFLLSQIAAFLVPFILFAFFFMFMTIPISYTLRDVKTAQQQIFLSAPIKSSDVLLGEFLGELPLYAIIIIMITGFFTALLQPAGLNLVQQGIIVLIFIVTLSSALWIGTVISALLRTRLGKSARGRDAGKALSLLIVLPAVGLMYAVFAIIDPSKGLFLDSGTTGILKTVLKSMPSSWGGTLIITFASHPGSIAALLPDIVTRLGGLILFFVVIVWAGMKVANRAYSLESTSFISPRAKSDGIIYRIIKQRGSSGILFVAIFKMYIRRLQNLSYIAYVVGLLVMMNIFFVEPGEATPTVEMGFFLFPLLAAFVAGDITLRGKETLFIYRKAPSGENRFIKAMIFKGWSVAVPITLAIVLTSLLLSGEAAFLSFFADTGLILLIVAADVLFASGLFLVMPAYTEKGGEFMLDVMVVAMTSVALFFITLIVFDEVAALPVFHWAVGISLLYIGKRKLNSIE